MQRTKIEYLTHSWNPLAMRCSPISYGCARCWHLAMAKRLAKNPMIDEDMRLAFDGGPVTWKLDEMEAPLRLRKPARIGVQFMGDLFHETISFEDQVKIFQVMATGNHWFYVLTKRPSKMQRFFQLCWDLFEVTNWPGIWLGVSVEDQKTADERIPILLQIPAAHRWVSVEPMLGPVDLEDYFYHGKGRYEDSPAGQRYHLWDQTINWIIAGGETGPGARPLYSNWVISLRDQCKAAGVPFFLKSWGTWLSKVDKKYSSHLLDGKEWREFPK